LGWIIQKGDQSLEEALFRWLNKFERSGKMAELHGFYFDFLNIFDYFDTKVFYKRLKTVLPKYERYFKRAGKKYDIPWTVLAAQSYQESHWNPHAKSYTGVRGMMMLTNETAKILKVKNRLSVQQSIDGGAKYFDMMRKLLPKDLDKKNLWAISLAAYNIGIGHIYDAQTLAKKLDKNPFSWKDLKTVLPLLSQKKYYKNLKYGYARGNEAVRYVDAIQHYYDIIVQSRMPKQEVKLCLLPKVDSKGSSELNQTTATKSK
jgi:membrane-bound lytic murein transglycosylase F